MVTLTIDNKTVTVPAGTTILDAARQVDIHIPTLCYLREINEVASCRICAVEVEGVDKLATACNTLVEEGMVVHTNTQRVRITRKTNVELILSQHVCNDYGGAMDVDNWAQVAYERMSAPPMPRPQPEPADDGSLPGAPWAPVPLFFASYSPVQTPQNACPWPAPYATFDREHTSYCVPFAEGEYSMVYPIPEHPMH